MHNYYTLKHCHMHATGTTIDMRCTNHHTYNPKWELNSMYTIPVQITSHPDRHLFNFPGKH